MRSEIEVKIVIDGPHLGVTVSGHSWVGTMPVVIDRLPEFDLIVGPDEATRSLLKDALVHVIEHL